MIRKIFNKLFGKREEISFKQGFDLTELPIVTFYQGDRKLNFILDTGASRSIIDENILENIEYKPLEGKREIIGVEGKAKVVPQCEITLSYKDTKYTYCYIISDLKNAFDFIKRENGVTLHGIIGATFFNEYKYVIDFNELIAYSKL